MLSESEITAKIHDEEDDDDNFEHDDVGGCGSGDVTSMIIKFKAG